MGRGGVVYMPTNCGIVEEVEVNTEVNVKVEENLL